MGCTVHLIGCIQQLETFFDRLPRDAVGPPFDATRHATPADRQAAVETSDVRLQWDSEHAPDGSKLGRRAVRLGLRGEALKALATTELLEAINMSPFVETRRAPAQSPAPWGELRTPIEHVYPFNADPPWDGPSA